MADAQRSWMDDLAELPVGGAGRSGGHYDDEGSYEPPEETTYSDDLEGIVASMTPSPAADPDFGLSPRQIELRHQQQAQADADALEQAGFNAEAERGVSALEALGPFALNETQAADLAADKAYQEEVEYESIHAAIERGERPDPVLVAQVEQENAKTLSLIDESVVQQNAILAQADQRKQQLAQHWAQLEQAAALAVQRQDAQALAAAQQQAQVIRQQYAQVEHQAVQLQETAEVVRFGARCETEFRQQRPDYDQAYSRVEQAFDEMQKVRYPNASAEQHQQVKAHVMSEFLSDCRRNGINPAEALYNKAIEFGHQPTTRTAVQKPQEATQATQHHQVPPSASPRAAQAVPAPSLEQIAAMSDRDFNAAFEEMKRAGYTMPRAGR